MPAVVIRAAPFALQVVVIARKSRHAAAAVQTARQGVLRHDVRFSEMTLVGYGSAIASSRCRRLELINIDEVRIRKNHGSRKRSVDISCAVDAHATHDR